MAFFKLARIKANELFQDAVDFTRTVYRQTNNLFTPASPWGQLLIVLRNLFSMVLYYIEDSITELNINTASRTNSIIGLSRLTGHNPTRAITSTGIIGIEYNGNVSNISGETIIVPNFVKLRCKRNNLPYLGVFGKDDLRFNINDNKKKRSLFRIYEGYLESQTFTGTGYTLQTYEASTKEGIWIDNFFVNVYVNGQLWRKVDSIYDMGYDEPAVIVKTGMTSGIDLIFGNVSNGAVPDAGAEILVEYLITDGEIGQIDTLESTKFVFEDIGYDGNGYEVDLNSYFNIGLATPVLGGSNPEPIELTKLMSPPTSRSFVLAQTSNYELFFERMQRFSQIKVFTEYNRYDPYIDNVVYIMLIPDVRERIISGQNYFNCPLELFYISEFEMYEMYRLLEQSGQKIIGSIPYIIQPEFQFYSMDIFINIWRGYDENIIRENIINKISNYLLNLKRKDYVPKSDLIAIIETVDGVDSVDLTFISKDVEHELGILMNREKLNDSGIKFQTQDWMLLQDFYFPEIYDVERTTDLTYDSVSVEEAFQFISSIDSVKTYLNGHFDKLGNIVLEKNKYPLFRGGWSDRFGNFIEQNLDKDRLSPINIYVNKKIENSETERLNKININQIKNL